MHGKLFLSVFAFLLFGVTLINNNYHVSPFGFSYYAYSILASALIIGSGLVLFKHRNNFRLSTKFLPIFFFLVYTAYYFLQGHFFADRFLNHGHIYLAINSLLLLAYFICQRIVIFDLTSIGLIVTLLAFIECAVCFSQYLGLVESMDTYFKVTGSLANPNMTAIFMVMALPFILPYVYENRRWPKLFSIATLFFVLVSLLLLKCSVKAP